MQEYSSSFNIKDTVEENTFNVKFTEVDSFDFSFESAVISEYVAGNGITIINRVISLDDLIIDCGTSNTVIFGGE